MKRTSRIRIFLIVAAICAVMYSAAPIHAQTSPSVLYVPLIGITSVPTPLALPQGPGNVTYNYAVKNFIREVALSDVRVEDDTCSPVKFVEGDDNANNLLDYDETWRYSCSMNISATTQSAATVVGTANNITATHKAYATVVVGSNTPPPLVSIINVTKVAYPLSLPPEGGDITYTYKVNNPGVVPLNDVSVTDDKCSAMSGRLGDTNGNNKLDTNEVWIYTCTTNLTKTTTNTVHVEASANGLLAKSSASLTVTVDTIKVPDFPNVGDIPESTTYSIMKIVALSAGVLFVVFIAMRKNRKAK